MLQNDIYPPPNWPAGVAYLARPRLDRNFPAELIPALTAEKGHPPRPFNPHNCVLAPSLEIKTLTDRTHPHCGERALVATRRIPRGTLLLPYLGIIHAVLPPDPNARKGPKNRREEPQDKHGGKYDLRLVDLPGSNLGPVSIRIDAEIAGNAARFIHDHRGIGTATAELRFGRGLGGELALEVWSRQEMARGDLVLVDFDKWR